MRMPPTDTCTGGGLLGPKASGGLVAAVPAVSVLGGGAGRLSSRRAGGCCGRAWLAVIGGVSRRAGASSSARSERSPNRLRRVLSCILAGVCLSVRFRGGGRGGTCSRACSFRSLVADDRWMTVPTFGTLVRALAPASVIRPVVEAVVGRPGVGSVRPRSRRVRMAPRFLGSLRVWFQRTSNSSSVAASAGLMRGASVSSAMASETSAFIPSWRCLFILDRPSVGGDNTGLSVLTSVYFRSPYCSWALSSIWPCVPPGVDFRS